MYGAPNRCLERGETGKTTTIAAKAVHFACVNPKMNVLIAAPSRRQSMILFERVVGFFFACRPLARSIRRKTRTVVELKNGSRVIALPCSGSLLRGFSADMVICDEAAFMPEDVIVEVIFPMLSTTDGYAILLSTPWGRAHFFHRAFIDPDFSVHKVKSSECPLISAEFLKKQRQFMTEEAYLREYEAEFVEASMSYFGQDLIRSCIDAELEFMDEAKIMREESELG